MSNINVRACDGCMTPVDDNQIGRKVVIGCLGPYPPSVVFDYCSTCTVPDLHTLARAKPWHLIQEIKVSTETGWATKWSGGIEFNPDTRKFTNGYEKVLEDV